MRLPRFRSIRLSYGCHEGRFEWPDEPRPVVICGPNGSGKTTLLEAPLRTLYGFIRRRPEDRHLLELRQPWSGRPAEGEVDLVSSAGRSIRIRRDFSSDEVVVTDLSDGTELFRGDGNPVGVRSESRRYRELLREWIGFAEFEPYRKTAWVGQGELIDTRLDDELLRAAAGTHRRVEGALEELKEAFDSLTCESIEPGGRRKSRARELEDLREEHEDLRQRVERARTARERRRPLRQSAREVGEAIQRLDAEIEILEAAFRPLSERRTLLAEQRQITDRLNALSDAIRWLREAAAAAESASAELEGASSWGAYPHDIESRLGQAEVLWEMHDALSREAARIERPPPPPAPDSAGRPDTRFLAAGAAVALLGLWIGVAVSWLAGLLVGLCGVALALAALRWPRGTEPGAVEARRLRRELEEVDGHLAAVAEGIPPPLLAPATLEVHRERHRALTAARERSARTRERLQDALERARRLLGPEIGPAAASDATSATGRLEEAEGEARTALARVQLRLESQPVVPELPPGVEATVSAVEAARAERRVELAVLVERRTALDLELRDMERASEDVFVLDRQVNRVRERIAATEEEVAVRRFAWELVKDAYAEFRGQDQSRLVAAVDARLEALSGRRLGPIFVEADLLSARVGLAGRSVALESPPLSFGERHLVLLAIRLGAADFLSGENLRHPVLVDEPFAHLDEFRAAEVWNLLTDLARERQVVVTTQNRLVLAHLGVAADFELALADARGDVATAAERTDRAPASEERSDRKEVRSPAPSTRREPTAAPERSAVPEQAQLDLG